MIFTSNYFISIVLGLLLIMLGQYLLKKRLLFIFSLLLSMIFYFFKDSSKIERDFEDNPIFSFGGWAILIGLFLVLAGLFRWLGSW